jgi:hypothetical protein
VYAASDSDATAIYNQGKVNQARWLKCSGRSWGLEVTLEFSKIPNWPQYKSPKQGILVTFGDTQQANETSNMSQ